MKNETKNETKVEQTSDREVVIIRLSRAEKSSDESVVRILRLATSSVVSCSSSSAGAVRRAARRNGSPFLLDGEGAS